ncbi:MAG: hypothetical protein HDT20_00875 [Oscillibacter sp.]|nr:hypothetical protein [Oscillibacter sp.]
MLLLTVDMNGLPEEGKPSQNFLGKMTGKVKKNRKKNPCKTALQAL